MRRKKDKFVVVDIAPNDATYKNREKYIGRVVVVNKIHENTLIEGYQSAYVKFSPPIPSDQMNGYRTAAMVFYAVQLETLENAQAEKTNAA